MKGYTTIGIMVGAALLAHAPTASAQRWGREATPRSGVCFYEDINFNGRYFCSPVGAVTEGVPSGMNDRISSIRVFGNAVATLYRDPNLRGQAKVVEYDIPDMRRMGFNDRVSSYVIDGGFNRGRNRGPGYGYQGNESRWSYRDAEMMVRRSYQSVLGRNPDPAGLRDWTQEVMRRNWSQRELESALRQSDEYRALRGTNRAVPRANRR
jgi:hypothetical protein